MSGKTTKKKLPPRVGGSFAFYTILISIAVLLGISILMVVSAQSGEYVIKQVERQAEELSEQGEVPGLETINAPLMSIGVKHLIPIALGIIACWVVSRINYQLLIKLAIPISLFTLFLLLLVPLIGEETLGAKRWFSIAGQSLQPSELAKPALIVLAVFTFIKLRASGASDLSNYETWILPLGITLASLGLVMLQPDMGTTLIMIAGIVAVYLIMELPLMRLVSGLGFAGIIGFAAIMLIPNRRSRLFDFFASFGSDADIPYQNLQAKIAFGSGGLIGLGPGLSRQKYRYLPEAQNDFILAIIGEELGLLGIILVIGAFVMLAWAGFKIAISAKDISGRALAGGALITILMQAILNIYSVIGLGPVTGKPLPFVTQGGSAMIGAFILLGLILSVSRYGNQKELKLGSGAGYATRLSTEPRANLERNTDSNLGRSSSSNPARSTSPKPERNAGLSTPPKANTKRKSSRSRVEDDDDEVNLDWRGDRGSHIPRDRTR